MVKTEIKERVGYVILDRQEKKNAFDPQMIHSILEAFESFEKNPDVKAVILSSSGDVFCAGADLEYLKTIQSNSYDENLTDSQLVKQLFHKIYAFPKLTIAQVEGHAIAGGAGLANVCDFCYTVPEAKFGYSEVKIGFLPAIVSVFLIRKIGESKARELLLTGRLIGADEAHSCGIANQIFSASDIKDKTFLIAKNLVETTSMDSIRLTKELLLKIQDLDPENAMDLAAKYNAQMRETNDFKKGINAFLNKEKLTW